MYHRDRVSRHEGHYKIDCVSDAPKSVQVKSRRSIRHASKAALQIELQDALEEMRENAE